MMDLNPETNPTLTIEAAAKLLGLCRSSAYLAAQTGDLPTIRMGRRILVPTAALARLLQIDATA